MLMQRTASACATGRSGIESECQFYIGEIGSRRPSVDAGAGGRVRVSRLEVKRRNGEAGEVDAVLARAGGDLQHQAARRQLRCENSPDGIAVARRRRREEAGVVGHQRYLGVPLSFANPPGKILLRRNIQPK
jgi:hypothetical protein